MAVDLLETAPADPAADWRDAQVGRYVLRRFVGAGGMGVVVAAHDPELDREVAIKIVAGDETARPIREAQAMARLSHPNVVQVYEVLRLGARTAIVMELVEGEELGAWQVGRPWRAIVDAYVQASRGLAAAHRAGIVHRDFKPSNALVDREGAVRVTDFGVARHAAGDADEAGSVGTPVYMAPEQHRKAQVDARTDQWALACALYEALYGRRPFAAAEGTDLAAAVIRGDVAAEPSDTPVPRRIRAAIRRALATDPADRFARLDDFAAVLAARPRTAAFAIGGAVLVIVVIATVLLARRGEATTCTGLDQPMRDVWTAAARTDLRARLTSAGLPAAGVDRTLAKLDAYATSWGTTRTGACIDARAGVRAGAMLDARIRCLDHRRAAVAGLLEALAAADAATLRATNDAVAQLPPLATCDDAPAAPTTPALDAAENELARATVLVSLSQFERALPLVEHVLAAAADTPSLAARALVLRGETEDRLGTYGAALATYQQAAQAAARARDHVVVADALARAFLVEGDHLGRRAEALRDRPFIELALESAGQPDAVRAAWLHFLAIMLYDDSSLVDEAARYERESLAIRQRTLPPDHLYIYDSLETLANIEGARKNFDESARILDGVLAARIASRGPIDGLVSSAYNNRGVVEIRRNRLLAALTYLEPAVATGRAAGRPNSNASFNLGLTQLELGRARAAVDTFRASLDESKKAAGPGSRQVATGSIFVGVALLAAGDVEHGRPFLVDGLAGARAAGATSITTALCHASLLALHDGDRTRARTLLDEALALPASNAPLRVFATAELARVESGCTRARALYANALEAAIADSERAVQTRATLALARCEIAAGDGAAAKPRLEAELTWLDKVGADEVIRAPLRDALARLQ